MTNEQSTLMKAVINSDIKQFQTSMREMIDRRIVDKMRERRDNVYERCGFKRLEQDK